MDEALKRTKSSWSSMRARCYNKSNGNFCRYGGRGITVCDAWVKFDAFFKDMGLRPEGKTLDRINNELGYFPENCRWATTKEQARNTRCTNQRWIEHNGETLSVTGWEARMGLGKGTIHYRLQNGWPTAAAISTPRATTFKDFREVAK